jgi:hypothetical protein
LGDKPNPPARLGLAAPAISRIYPRETR